MLPQSWSLLDLLSSAKGCHKSPKGIRSTPEGAIAGYGQFLKPHLTAFFFESYGGRWLFGSGIVIPQKHPDPDDFRGLDERNAALNVSLQLPYRYTTITTTPA